MAGRAELLLSHKHTAVVRRFPPHICRQPRLHELQPSCIYARVLLQAQDVHLTQLACYEDAVVLLLYPGMHGMLAAWLTH